MMMTLNEDDLKPRRPRTEGTCQRGTMALFRANIYQDKIVKVRKRIKNKELTFAGHTGGERETSSYFVC